MANKRGFRLDAQYIAIATPIARATADVQVMTEWFCNHHKRYCLTFSGYCGAKWIQEAKLLDALITAKRLSAVFDAIR